MTSDQLVAYINAAAIFSPRKLEAAAGLANGTIGKALSGERKLSDKAVEKILHVFKSCGVTPV